MNTRPPAYNPNYPAGYAPQPGMPNGAQPPPSIYPNLGGGMPMPMPTPTPVPNVSIAGHNPLPPGYPGATNFHPSANETKPMPGGVPVLPGGNLPPGYPGQHSSPHHSPKPAHGHSSGHHVTNVTPPGYPAGAVPVLGGHPSSYAVPHASVGGHGTQHGFVFRATVEEVKKGKMEMQYCPSVDMYYRPSGSTTVQMHGWKSGIFSEHNISHKTEHDWKKVYLARNPGAGDARIEWRFDTSGYKIKSIKVEFKCKTYHSAKIQAYVLTDANQRFDLNIDKDKQKFKNPHNARKFSIIAELCGGSGNDAWQHTQLFRQDSDDKGCPFEVVVKLEK